MRVSCDAAWFPKASDRCSRKRRLLVVGFLAMVRVDKPELQQVGECVIENGDAGGREKINEINVAVARDFES